MRKPFTTLAGLLLLIVAGVQAYRAYLGLDVSVGDFHVPVMASWIASGVAGLLGLGVFAESGR